jgi:hypothetical protein
MWFCKIAGQLKLHKLYELNEIQDHLLNKHNCELSGRYGNSVE